MDKPELIGEDFDRLLTSADLVPEMGCGGRVIRNALMREAYTMKHGYNIIDQAPFIGSTTAYLALGLLGSKNYASRIVSIDTWNMSIKYKTWLEKRNLDIDDLEKAFMNNMAPFIEVGANIKPFKSSLNKFKYPYSKPIGIIVNDIGCDKKNTDLMLLDCLPYMIPDETIIFFMDFYFFEIRNDYQSRTYQRDLMEFNKNVFEFLERPENSQTAIYKYKGGDINFIDGCHYYYSPKKTEDINENNYSAI